MKNKKPKTKKKEVEVKVEPEDVSLNLTIKCPFCGKKERLITLYVDNHRVNHYCSCGKTYAYCFKISKKPSKYLLMKFEIFKLDIKGFKSKDGYSESYGS